MRIAVSPAAAAGPRWGQREAQGRRGASTRRTAALLEGPVGRDAVLLRDDLPELRPDLIAGLAGLDVHNLPHCRSCGRSLPARKPGSARRTYRRASTTAGVSPGTEGSARAPRRDGGARRPNEKPPPRRARLEKPPPPAARAPPRPVRGSNDAEYVPAIDDASRTVRVRNADGHEQQRQLCDATRVSSSVFFFVRRTHRNEKQRVLVLF